MGSATSGNDIATRPSGRIRVFLAGPPWSGKSSAGGLLAALLDVPFSDLDRRVEASAGLPVPGIFRRDGEAAFREHESRELRRAVAGPGSFVLALGGGTLLDPRNLALVLSVGIVITLWAEPSELVRRMAPDGPERPLSTDPAGLLRLLGERRTHYLSLPCRIDTTGRTLPEVAREAAALIAGEPLT